MGSISRNKVKKMDIDLDGLSSKTGTHLYSVPFLLLFNTLVTDGLGWTGNSIVHIMVINQLGLPGKDAGFGRWGGGICNIVACIS